MSLAIHDASGRPKPDEPASPIRQAAGRNAVNGEALSRLPELDIGELRRQWRSLYKAEAPRHLSRALLVRAVAYRMQELAGGGPARSRSASSSGLHSSSRKPEQPRYALVRPELKPGTRLMREWQGRRYDVLVLDDGFSWQGTCYRSLSAIARKITGTAWSGPLFFGLKPKQPAAHRSLPVPDPAGDPTASRNAAG